LIDLIHKTTNWTKQNKDRVGSVQI